MYIVLIKEFFCYLNKQKLLQEDSLVSGKNWAMYKIVLKLSEGILSCHSLSLNADLCIHFYWLSQQSQVSHRQMIQNSALKLRLWLCHFKISKDTPAFIEFHTIK